MKPLINWLKERDWEVVACCCGHSKYPMTIIVRYYGEEPYYQEILSGIVLGRKKKFYKKDKQGYYFIPEVLNQSKKWKTNY